MIPKLAGLAGVVMFLLFSVFSVKPQNDRFVKYKAVEAYEIRPGILMMPRYSDEGQVCSIEIERRHYADGTAFLDSQLPHEVMIQIIDELVPVGERGPQSMNFGREYMSEYSGNSVTAF